MKGKVEKKMGLFLLCCLCVDIMNVSSVYGAENGELFDHTSEVRTEESIEKGLPSGLELFIESKTLLVGDVLQIGIVAENALNYEIVVCDTETTENVYVFGTDKGGVYPWELEQEGRFTIFFRASNEFGTAESQKYYMHVVETRGTWVQFERKWKYELPRNNYAADTILKIDGKYYSFDEQGYMETGWKYVNHKWYYYRDTGARAIGWEMIDGKWYYLNEKGDMLTGWKQYNKDWYYLKPSGAMATGWEQVNGVWYWFDTSGKMVTGWKKIGGEWYYFSGSGAMQSNTWIENYYLGSSGAMLTNTWVGNYYVDNDGLWVKDMKPHK